MTCRLCSNPFNLGLRKPLKSCCSTICYTCLFNRTRSESSCDKCSASPLPITSYQVDPSILEGLWVSDSFQELKRTDTTLKSKEPCSICKKFQVEFATSKVKNGICAKCNKDCFLYKTLSDEFRCTAGHRFINSDVQLQNSECVICHSTCNITTHCFLCKVHLCKHCSVALQSVISKLNLLKCDCNGEILWKSFEKLKICSTCSESQKKIGKFQCSSCEKSFCLSCLELLFDSLSCFRCKASFSLKKIPKISEKNEIFCEGCYENEKVFESRELSEIFKRKCQDFHSFLNNQIQAICRICKTKGQMWVCQYCSKAVCEGCVGWINRSTLAPEYPCTLGHYPRLSSISSDKVLKCRSCKSQISGSSIDCQTCEVSQCSDCHFFHRDIKSQNLVLACICGSSYQDLPLKVCTQCKICHKSYKKSGSFFCRKCKNLVCTPCAKSLFKSFCQICKITGIKGEISLKKIPCGHFICVSCYSNLKYFPETGCPVDNTLIVQEKEEKIISCEEHKFLEKYLFETKCSLCGKMKSDEWYCENCEKVYCGDCKTWFMDSVKIEDNLTCFKKHKLRLTKNAEKYYNRNGKFLCDGCDDKKSGNSAHCRKCKMDYCEACFKNIRIAAQFFEVFKCKCKGCVKWNSVKGGKCSNCKKAFEKSGFFKCDGCKKMLCIKCSVKGRKEKCDKCGKKFLKKQLKPFVEISGLVVCESCFSSEKGK